MHRMQPRHWMWKKKETPWHIVFKQYYYYFFFLLFAAGTRDTPSSDFYARAANEVPTNNTNLKFTSHIAELPFVRCWRSRKMNKTRNIYFFFCLFFITFKNSWANFFLFSFRWFGGGNYYTSFFSLSFTAPSVQAGRWRYTLECIGRCSLQRS